jgi:hypothetical protein
MGAARKVSIVALLLVGISPHCGHMQRGIGRNANPVTAIGFLCACIGSLGGRAIKSNRRFFVASGARVRKPTGMLARSMSMPALVGQNRGWAKGSENEVLHLGVSDLMLRHANKFFIAIALCAFTSAASSHSQAGILSGHGAAFGGVTGSVPFNNGVGLSGTIDYAVFTANDFNANFGGLGYVPGGALVYTYQVFATGSLGVSAESVGVTNPANTIGTFNLGGQNASSASFTPTTARWLFAPEIPGGASSWGLAFSSPNLPIVGGSLTVDGGTTAFAAGVPTPGPVAIPEPTTLFLIAASFAVGCLTRRFR